ncbi:beta-lactamase/transpeptidase-like protein [Xylaria telfairii]|nr:beta-lactamase/transpeptidase-like protein [Xylaria telfairii]
MMLEDIIRSPQEPLNVQARRVGRLRGASPPGPFALATKVFATTPYACALAGPGFPSPSGVSNSPLLSASIAEFEKSLNDVQLGLQANDTAWAVALFSSKENKTLYEHYYTPPIDVGVSQVDSNSIFRIGSVSKVFSVWSFLIEVGDKHFNEPITKYVPELANLTCNGGSNDREIYNDIDHVRWEEITLGQLASHAAGIPRDPTFNDLAASLDSNQASALGLPALDKDEIPTCGIPGVTRICTRSELFSYLLKQAPLYPTAHSPAYSNVAYTLLGYAQQAITGTPISDAVATNIFEALAMTNSSFSRKPSSGGVIPGGNESQVGWDEDLGPTSPAGSIYSSTSDMVKAGQAILQSKLLSPAQTRRWLKPLTQTGYLSTAVGAPWEIRYLSLSDQRVSQLYTKQGDEGTYHAALVLSPEHDLGWVVLAADTTGVNAGRIRETVMNSFGDLFLSVAEQQAENEAEVNFAGIFNDEATNSSVRIQAGPSGSPGLLVTGLTSHGAQVIGPESPLIQLYGVGQFARLYPSNLRATSRTKGGSGTYDSRLGFRATYFNATEPGKVQDPCLQAWTALGAPLYGQVALDDWVFQMREDGQAEALDVGFLRLRLQRVN